MQVGIGAGTWITIITTPVLIGIGIPIIMATILESVSLQDTLVTDPAASGLQVTGRLYMTW